ncbi:hypothetical protein D3C75_914830 [compost metagenome]
MAAGVNGSCQQHCIAGAVEVHRQAQRLGNSPDRQINGSIVIKRFDGIAVGILQGRNPAVYADPDILVCNLYSLFGLCCISRYGCCEDGGGAKASQQHFEAFGSVHVV